MDKQTPKPKPIRGTNGRFISTNKPDSNTASPIETAPLPQSLRNLVEDRKTVTSPLIFDDLSYYGQSIKRMFKNELWYFAFEDFFPLVQIADPPNYIDFIKSKPFYKKLLGTDILEVNLSPESADVMLAAFGSKKAIQELVSAFREREKIFPGPFLQWIETTSQLTLEEQLERSEDREKNANL